MIDVYRCFVCQLPAIKDDGMLRQVSEADLMIDDDDEIPKKCQQRKKYNIVFKKD